MKPPTVSPISSEGKVERTEKRQITENDRKVLYTVYRETYPFWDGEPIQSLTYDPPPLVRFSTASSRCIRRLLDPRSGSTTCDWNSSPERIKRRLGEMRNTYACLQRQQQPQVKPTSKWIRPSLHDPDACFASSYPTNQRRLLLTLKASTISSLHRL